MRIVLDANIFISALLGSERIIPHLTRPKHIFYAPKKIMLEVLKYEELICKKSDRTKIEFEQTFNDLLKFVKIINKSEYTRHLSKARKIMNKRDIKDADYLACALAKKADRIWTHDKDFNIQHLVKTITDEEL